MNEFYFQTEKTMMECSNNKNNSKKKTQNNNKNKKRRKRTTTKKRKESYTENELKNGKIILVEIPKCSSGERQP